MHKKEGKTLIILQWQYKIAWFAPACRVHVLNLCKSKRKKTQVDVYANMWCLVIGLSKNTGSPHALPLLTNDEDVNMAVYSQINLSTFQSYYKDKEDKDKFIDYACNRLG